MAAGELLMTAVSSASFRRSLSSASLRLVISESVPITRVARPSASRVTTFPRLLIHITRPDLCIIRYSMS
jgi:hypothetical protein